MYESTPWVARQNQITYICMLLNPSKNNSITRNLCYSALVFVQLLLGSDTKHGTSHGKTVDTCVHQSMKKVTTSS